jgi:hypothetical protein
MSEHARLSPSAAERWSTCPGSVSLASTVVDSGSDAADQGTACHKMFEKAIKESVPVDSWLGKKILVVNEELTTTNEVEVTDEMIDWVMAALHWVADYIRAHPTAHVMSEERLHVGRAFGCPDEIWGTADVLISSDEEVVIADLKAGYGEVQVAGNPQLLLYAIGAMHEYGWAHPQARLVILQPRVSEPVKEIVLSAQALEDARRRFAPKIRAALEVNAPLVPSTAACKWCPAAGVCPAVHERTLALAKSEFSVESRAITKVQLVELLTAAPVIRAALNAAERHATKLLQSGVDLPGWKLVQGEKRRIWKDEKAAAAFLGKLGFDPYKKVLAYTPAQAEKAVGKTSAPALAPYIERPVGEATLAPLDDPRESVKPEFEAVPD